MSSRRYTFITMRMFLIFTFLFLLSSGTPVLAQTTTATTTATSTPIATTTPDVTAPPAPAPDIDRTVILERRAQERIINLAANISNKFDAIINRLQNITNRLNTRINKMKSEGYDTTSAEASLGAAQAALSEARTEMSTIDRAVVDAVGSQSPKTEWQKVRAKYFLARERIKLAHVELKNTVAALKGAGKISVPETATTSETTPQ